MTTIVRGPRPPELEAWLERRRRLGQDRRDEVWEGRYVVAPDPHSNHGDVQLTLGLVLKRAAQRLGLQATTSFNLGRSDDFRVPNAGLIPWPAGTWHDTVVLVVEILSPDDETFAKLDFSVGTVSPSCWWPTGPAVRCAAWRCRRTRRSAAAVTCSG